MAVNTLVRLSDAYSVAFFRLDGGIGLPGQELKKIEQQGVSGCAFKKMGWHAPARVMTGISFASDTVDLASQMVDYSSMQGQQVTLWDHAGFYLTGCVVLSGIVKEYELRAGGVVVGIPVGPVWRIVSQWVIEYPYGNY